MKLTANSRIKTAGEIVLAFQLESLQWPFMYDLSELGLTRVKLISLGQTRLAQYRAQVLKISWSQSGDL